MRKLVPVFAILFLAGCGSATTPPLQTTCFGVVDGVSRAVDIGMTVSGDLYRAGKVSEAKKVQLVAIFDTKYKPSITAAGYACKAVQDKSQLDKLLLDLQLGVKSLMEAIAAFGGA